MEVEGTVNKKDEERSSSWSQSVSIEEILSLPVGDVLVRLNTSQAGLSSQEVENRLQVFGRNELAKRKRRTGVVEVLYHLRNPLVFILLSAGLISGILGETIDATIIFSIVLLSVLLDVYQESKAEKSVEMLKKRVVTTATVLRDGVKTEVKLSEIVSGDTLYSDTSTSATTPIQRSGLNKKLRNNRLVSLGLTAFSLFCLSLTVALTFFYRTSVSFPPKQLAVSLFMVICCLGATAAVLPPKCSGTFHHRQTGDYRLLEGTGTNHDQWTVMFKGHHPTCGSFTNHVLQIRGKTYCAGCLGLLTGALIAIAVGLIYSLDIARFESETTFVFWFGFATVLVGLIQYAKPLMMKGSVHFFLNVVFVIGAFFLLVGVIEINGSIAVEMYLLVMTIYWIFTRIILSEREHERTCTICEVSSCAYHPH